MYYGTIKPCDVANGVGVRVSLFVSGCTNHCKNCFQPETWDFFYGQPFTSDTQKELLNDLAPDYIAGLSVLGGEPFEPENQHALLPLFKEVRSVYPYKTIWCYSGFTWEEMHSSTGHPRCEITDEILEKIDVLVDGRFDESLKKLTLAFRGSSNQRLIDVPKTLRQGHICLLEGFEEKSN